MPIVSRASCEVALSVGHLEDLRRQIGQTLHSHLVDFRWVSEPSSRNLGGCEVGRKPPRKPPRNAGERRSKRWSGWVNVGGEHQRGDALLTVCAYDQTGFGVLLSVQA